MWSEEEKRMCALAAMSAYHGEETIFIPPETLELIMTRAVELVAARGGTMTPVDAMARIAKVRASFNGFGQEFASILNAALMEIEGHLASQGARVAVLEKTLADAAARDWTCAYCNATFPEPDPCRAHAQACTQNPLVRQIVTLEAENVRMRRLLATRGEAKRLDAAMDQIIAIRPLISQLAALSVEMAKVVGDHTKHEHFWRGNRDGGQECDTCPSRRYPCSPTCTHDDAATPGHKERVKERSEAFEIETPGDEDAETLRSDAFDRGAEAMRAACLSAIQVEMEKRGASREEWESMKSAIEGAVP